VSRKKEIGNWKLFPSWEGVGGGPLSGGGWGWVTKTPREIGGVFELGKTVVEAR